MMRFFFLILIFAWSYQAPCAGAGAGAGLRLAELIKSRAVFHIWSEKRTSSAVENAYAHWKKHAHEFPDLGNALEYVDAAHRFVQSPPPGTLIKTRPTGDRMLYHPVLNIYAIQNSAAAPRTMFKPTAGHNYWQSVLRKKRMK